MARAFEPAESPRPALELRLPTSYVMYIFMYMDAIMDARAVSITEARAGLPGLIKAVEGGSAVQITRWGRPVAVLVSATTYQQLSSGRPAFGDVLAEFGRRSSIERDGLDRDEFKDLRDGAEGRAVEW